MNFPSQIFFDHINHGYRAAVLKKNSLWLLPFYMVVATFFYYEKVSRTIRLQLYQTSLIKLRTNDCKVSVILNTFNLLTDTFIIWLIIDQITVIKVRPNKRFINCNDFFERILLNFLMTQSPFIT